jgi:regulator of ribonuclease activity A
LTLELPVNYATTDLCDAHPEVQVLEPRFRDFGGTQAFAGPVTTVKVFEDNALVREALEERGDGRVLVIDGGGSMRCALIGGNLAELAVSNGWAGIIVNGCVRDSEEIGRLPLGVKALAVHPRKSEKGLHSGRRERTVTFGSATFQPGCWIYADADGVIVAAVDLRARG